MKILRLISSVNLKYGGPIEGVNQLSAEHKKMGVEVEICSLDSPDAECVRESQIKVHALGPAFSSYCYSTRIIPWLKLNANNYDAIIVQGLWQFIGFAAWRGLSSSSTPYYVFTHGMLDPWFKHTYPLKHLKKWIYWLLAEYWVLRNARRVIFTSEEERLLARQSFSLYNVNEAVTAYGVASPPDNESELIKKFIESFPHLKDKKIVLFLSRIHAKKGCDLLIEGFSRIVDRDEKLHLVIAGPDQEGWEQKLKAQAELSGITDRITWTGMLYRDMKWGAFYAADVFCLPSHQENFGIVVAEALACGKPVLISNKINIWREINEAGAGFVADDTLKGTIENFNKWVELDPLVFEKMKLQTKICFLNNFHAKKAAERLLEIIT
ncbi:Glycosyltransferase [hydrothermal vent metagenome]|uniref:Glycosyltransferase n=1 Tax=hydrothermal vent metagenome TaxID=652676 RepID=A0A3B0Y4T6_9ZZZZ